MYLKSLEMQGFKSFPDKTRLVFDAEGAVVNPTGKAVTKSDATGVTVIVGPNGSGKSNISDAMRWVLGEISSKTLRGSKMEDVIFGGADSRKPMGYAEVSVTFDNRGEKARLDCPYDEVTVTRRYYRAGESEYFINRRAVRLKDIYELFMNTGIGRDGYSIIGQGRIAEMISRKSEERRAIFEDASGIAKYRHKKTEAERKLQQTEDNMTRIRDIFSVIEAQVGPLAKESERAKRAIELMDNKKRADVSLWLYDTERLRRELDVAEENLNHSAFDLERAEEAVASMEEQNNHLFEQSQSNKRQSEELLSQIRTLTDETHALDSEYRVKENNVSHARELIAATQGSIESTDRSMQAEVDGCTVHHGKIAALKEQVEALTDEHDVLADEQSANAEKIKKLEENIATAQVDVMALEEQATDVRVRLSVIENAQESDDGKNNSMRSELENYGKISTDYDAQASELRKTIADYDESLSSLEAQTDELNAALEQTRRECDEKTTALNQANLRADALSQRIATYRSMEEHFEGYANSVRYVMKEYGAGNISGTIYGPLSQLISVDDRYITAIETALGANLQNIVVDNEATAKAAMYALKRGEAGRATFFPLTSMRASSETNEMKQAASFKGYLDVADRLIHADGKFASVLSSLLGRTVIFDDIDNATAMAKATGFRVRVVTLDGQQINVGGSFTGGSVKQKGGMLSRAGEIKRMEGELSETKKTVASLESAVRTLENSIHDSEDQIESLDQQKGLVAVLRASEAASLEQILAKRDANATLMEKLRAEYEQIALTHAKYEEELETLHAEETALATQIAEIRAARQEMDEQRSDLEDRQEELGRQLTDLFVRISACEKDAETEQMLISSAEGRIDAFAEQLEMLRGRMADYQRQIEQLTAEMAENRTQFEAGQAKLDGLNARRKLVEEDGFAFEKKLNELNRKMREKMDEKEQIFRVHTKNENKLQNLRAEQDKLSGKLWEDYELTRADALALGYPAVTPENRNELIALQTECRNKLRGMGSVDLNAVEKYKEVKEQYDKMSEQIDDLDKSRTELLGIIETLEKDMKTSFVDIFNQINENFGRVFSELFGGGSAELSLTDPDNVLESGIEIKAAPPGKIIKSLMQLSGGEQSFIGVALFFAILQANPTPFCILDEIEAALDEVNVERLAQYIKRYADDTQFIMITHRRGTMAAATRLYGVTMPEHGISKVLALDVENISKKKGDDWNGIFG